MSPVRLEYDPLAIREARAAHRWNARRSVSTANRFIEELNRAVGQIVTTPQRWPSYLYGTRFFRMRRFPYSVVFEQTVGLIHIVAVAHAKRRPGYWLRRLP